MKKFTIFFLMVFMFLGYQAKCETVLVSSGDDATAGRNHASWILHHGSVTPNASGMIASDYTSRSGGVYETSRVNATQSLQVHIEGPSYACSSAMVTLHAVVSDDPVTANTTYSYTWMSSTNHGSAGYSGAAGATNNQELVVNMSSASPVMYYKVIVQRYESGACQGPADTSAVFTLTRVARGTVTVTAAPTTACSQQTLTATTNSPAMVARWIWLKDGNYIANTGTNNTYVATAAGNYKAVAEYEGSDMCNDTSEAVTVSFSASTLHLAASNATGLPAPMGNDFVCLGGQVRLKATNGAAPYSFYRGTTLIGTSNDSIFDVPPTTGTITYSVVDAGGCSADTTFTVLDGAGIEIYSQSGTHFCQPTGVSLTMFTSATQFLALGPDAYHWIKDGSQWIDGSTTTLFTSAVPTISEAPHTYTLEIYDPGRNCFYRSNTIEVYVYPQPTATLIADSVCSGNAATLTVETDGYLGDNPVYTWSTNAHGTAATAVTDELTSDATVSVTIVGLTPTQSCSVTASTTVKVVNTVASGEITAEPALVCNGDSVLFSAEAIGAGFTNPTYTWGGDASGSAATALVTGVTAPVTATVTVTGGDAPSTACSVTATKTVEVTTALPTATSVNIHTYLQGQTVDALGACIGGAIDVVATGITPSDEYIYTWYRNGIELPAHDTAFTDNLEDLGEADPFYSLIYTLVISHVNGCGSVSVESDTLGVFTPGEITLSSDRRVCSGTDVTVVAMSPYLPIIGAQYAWFLDGNEVTGPTMGPGYSTQLFSAADGLTAQLAPHVITAVAYYDPMTYAGCTALASATIEIQVDTLPTVRIVASDSVLCEDGEVTLTAIPSTDDIPAVVYAWNTLDSTATITVDAAGTYVVNLTQIYSNPSCTATASYEVKTATKPTVTLAADHDTICSGTQVTLTATATFDPAAGDSTYTWYRNGVEIATTTTNTYTESLTTGAQVSTYIYNVVAGQTTSGCVSEPAFDTVSVYPAPTVMINGDNILCSAGTVNLTAEANDTIAGVTYTYSWRLDNASVGTGKTYSTALSLRDNPYIFTVQITNEATGCVTTSAEFPVYVDTMGSITVNASEAEICEGGDVVLTTTFLGSSNNDIIYQWYHTAIDDANIIAGANANTYTATNVTTATIYYLQATQISTSCAVSGYAKVEVSAVPSVTLALNSAETICSGGQASLTATATQGVSGIPYTYTWYRNGVEIDGANGASLTETLTAENTSTIYAYTVVASQEASGCESQPSDPKKVTVVPAPSVSIEGDALICAVPGTVTLTANINDTISGVTYNYQWRRNNADIAGATTATLSDAVTYQEEPYIYTVEVENTTTGCRTISEAYPVYVDTLAGVVVSADDTIICQGGDVVLTANLVDNNAQNLTYQWYSDDSYTQPIAGATQSELTVQNVTATTTYGVVVTQSTTGCSVKSNREITVNNDPLVESVTITPAADTVCTGTAITVEATMNTGTGYGDGTDYTYTWYRNGVEVAGANAATLNDVVTAEGIITPYIYTVVATQASSGCASTVAKYDTVKVVPMPTVAINGDNLLCAAGTVNLTAVANDTIPGVAYTYSWRMDNVTVGTGNTYSTTLDLRDNPYIFTVQITNATTGCTATSGEFPVYVDSLGNITVSASETEICEGGDVVLTTTFLGAANSDIVYEWYTGSISPTTLILGASDNTYTASNVTTTTTYYVQATQISTGCVVNGNVKVNVNQDPKPVLTMTTPEVICSGTQASFTVTSSLGVDGMPYTYTWYRNGVEIEGAIVASLTEELTTEGESTLYSYTVVASQDASGCVSQPSDPEKVTVVPAPSVSVEGDALICSDPGTVTLTAHINDTVSGMTYNYQWRRNNADIAGATSATMTETVTLQDEPYLYTVEVVNLTTGCRTISEEYPVYVDTFASVIVTVDDSVICNGGEVTLTANIGNYNTQNLTYQWFDDATYTHAIPGATQRELTVQNLTTTTTYGVQVVQTTTGCNAKGNKEVTVKSDPVVQSVVITPSTDTVCTGSTITVTATMETGTDYGDGNAYTYTWYRNGVEVEGSHEATLTEVVTAEGLVTPYIYTVVASQPSSGCASTTFVYDTVFVRPMPTVTIEGDPIVCTGTKNVQLQARVNDNFATANLHYQWRLFNANIGTDDAELLDTRNASDNEYVYNVIITDATLGCQAVSEPFSVRVDTAAVITFLPVEPICVGGTATITASLNDYNVDDYTFQWYDGTTPIAGATSLTYTTPVLDATTTYTFKAIRTASGCEGSADVDVTVVSDPVSKFTVNPKNICQGGQVTLNSTVVIPAGITNPNIHYFWYRNGQLLEGVDTASFVDNPTIEDMDSNIVVYSLYVTFDNAGCASNLTYDTVNIYQNPTITVTGDQLLCGNADQNVVNLTATLNDTIAGTYTFMWREDNVNTDVTTRVYSQAKQYRQYPYEYTVVVTGPNGCSVVSEPYLVYVNDTLVVGVDATTDRVCAGEEVILTAAVADNYEALTYRWYTVEGASETELPNEYNNTLTTYPTATTHYRVRVMQNNTFCTAVGDTTITVVTAPNLALEILPAGTDSICEGGQITLALNPATAPAGTYSWYRNNELISTDTTRFFVDSPLAVDGDRTMVAYEVRYVQDSTSCHVNKFDTIYVFKNFDVVISGDPTVCDYDMNVTLTATVNGMNTGDALTATWYRDGINASTMGTIINSTDNSVYKADHDAVRTGESSTTYIYTVEISRGNGCTTMSDEYPVTIYKAPVVEVTADDTTICQNGQVTFTANLVDNNATDLTYEWKVNDIVVAGATSNTMTYTFLTTSEQKVVCNIAQTISSCNATDTLTFTPKATPVVAVDADNDTICSGYQVTVVATPTTYIAGEPITYTWYKNGEVIEGATDSVIYDNPVAEGAFGTNYVYGVAISQPSSACASAVVTDTVIVKGNPTVAISGDAIICHNDSIGLVANVNDYDASMGDLAYQWRLNNADIAGATNDTLIENNRPAADEPYIYTVVVTNTTDGCSVESAPYEVYVNDTIRIVVTSDIDSLCEGAEVTLTAHLGNYNTTDLIYRWYEEGVEIPGATERVITVVPANTGWNHYRVDVLQTTSECAASGEDSVKVLDAPTLAIFANTTMVCSGGEVIISAEASQEGAYTWYKNGVLIPGATMDTLIDSPLAIDNDSTAYVYSVIFASDIAGCTATKDTTVYAYPNPTIAISGDPMICDGTDVVLVAHVNGYDTTTAELHYQWMLANTNMTVASATTDTLTYTAADSTDAYSFSVMVYDNAGCRSFSDIYYVYVNDSIEVVVTADDTTICENGTVTLTAQLSDYNENNLTYQWYKGSIADANAIAGATSSTLTTVVPTTETYYVQVFQTTTACVAEGSQTIHAETVPVITSIDLSDTAVCVGYAIQVTAHANGGVAGEPYTFTWYRNGVLVEGITDSVFTDAAPLTAVDVNSYVYSATVSQPSSACTSARFDAEKTLNVYSLPTVQISGDASLCLGDTVALWAHIQNDDATPFNAANTTWAWRLNNNDVSSNPMMGDMINPGTIYYKENRINHYYQQRSWLYGYQRAV